MLSDCLAGTRVLDLTLFIPGPLATQWLSDLGAEVVKVESPAGDPMRTMGPVDADGSTPFYKLANRNKTVIALDLKDERGHRQFETLVAKADVLVEGFRPGVLERLGFGPARLAELNPRLVHCGLSGYGQTGPWAKRAGHDLTYAALAGALWATGPEARPVMTFPPLADHAGAGMVVTAVLAALLRRGRTGKGTHLDVSLSEAALGWMGGILTMAERGLALGRETGPINGGAAFYRIYRCRDGRFLAVAPLEAKFWAAFCTALGREEWIHRQAEPMPQNELIADLDSLLLTKTRDEWAALLAPADCCVEPVLEPAEVLSHPQTRARDLVQRDDGLAEVLLPMLMDGARARKRRRFVDADPAAVVASWR
ncbi:MAG: CoA transferase [Magnetospirillum sp.]|nr:CoA transferase [Magnetospirillum sp.]